MVKPINYEPGESIATGFVRPKVTALFFDKIWIPGSLAERLSDFYVPDKVLVQEETELLIRQSSRKSLAGAFYEDSIISNISVRASDMHLFASQKNAAYFPDEVFKEEVLSFKFSRHRNNAIMISAEAFCRKYGVHISPIYHDLTDFERDTKEMDFTQLPNHRSLKLRLRRLNTFLNKDALAICIQDFPSVIEEELSWEQVLDTRSDKTSIQHLKQFTKWCNKTLSDKSPEEIRDTLYSELESYKVALKKHGIVTATGSFTTIISTASAFSSIISGLSHPLLPLLSIAAVPINFGANTFFSNLANRNNPIAYLYDIGAEIAQ